MSISIVLTMMLFIFHGQTTPSQKPPRYVLDRAPDQGHLWLNWTAKERELFLFGYLRGYRLGFSSACLDYFDAMPPKVMRNLSESPLQKYNLQQLNFSNPANYYSGRITEFYQKFESDRDLPISWLFQALSDSEHKSLEEIHAA